MKLKSIYATLLLLVLCLNFTACSTNGGDDELDASAPSIEAEGDISEADLLDDDAPTDENDEVDPEEEMAQAENEDKMENESEAPLIKEQTASSETPSGVGATDEQGQGTYSVKAGETLMMISYKLYGDYGKWRSLANMNGLTSSSRLKDGMVLKYDKAQESFPLVPSGTPYIINQGDTLGKISNKFYQTPKRWKDIWTNNSQLIKDPNIIFAGFTLYVLQNEMASVQ